jgi:nitroreductase
MMFEAQELGLATLWLGAFDREIIIKEFNLSDNIIPICILLIGYVSDDAKPSSYMHFEKKKPEEIVEYL